MTINTLHPLKAGFLPLFLFLLGLLAIVVIVNICKAIIRGKSIIPSQKKYRKSNADFDNNSITHNHATWEAAHTFNNQDMNNEMNTNGTSFSDKDHDGIPDQVDTHDNRFDHTMSNDSTSSFDTNTWSNDSSSGGFDSGGSSGGSTDSNNNF